MKLAAQLIHSVESKQKQAKHIKFPTTVLFFIAIFHVVEGQSNEQKLYRLESAPSN